MFGNAFTKFKKGQAAMSKAGPSPVSPAPAPPKSNHPIHMLKMPKKFGRSNA